MRPYRHVRYLSHSCISDEVHLTPLTRTMQMRAHLQYLDQIDVLEASNAKKERRVANGQEGGDSDSGVGSAGGSDEEGKATAAEQRAAQKKRKENAEKKKKEGENKTVQIKVDDTLEVTASGDVKTARAAASLFGPKKAAEEEKWVDLPYYESTVRPFLRSSSLLGLKLSILIYPTPDMFPFPIIVSQAQQTRFTRSSIRPVTTSWPCSLRLHSIYDYDV